METLAQAGIWEERKNWYLKRGMCFRCACQMAWGHQIGFTEVDPPCEGCKPNVSPLPVALRDQPMFEAPLRDAPSLEAAAALRRANALAGLPWNVRIMLEPDAVEKTMVCTVCRGRTPARKGKKFCSGRCQKANERTKCRAVVLSPSI